jgi:hypothetical protein
MPPEMDKEHAEILRGVERTLNNALHEAWKAGLKVEIKSNETHMLGYQPLAHIHVNIYRPL